MEDFNQPHWQIIEAKAPENMFEKVRARIVEERVQSIKTHRQLAVGAVLLLVVAGLNIGLLLLNRAPKQVTDHDATLLYKTYFDTQLSLDNEP